jgi:hypothetical protein
VGHQIILKKPEILSKNEKYEIIFHVRIKLYGWGLGNGKMVRFWLLEMIFELQCWDVLTQGDVFLNRCSSGLLVRMGFYGL